MVRRAVLVVLALLMIVAVPFEDSHAKAKKKKKKAAGILVADGDYFSTQISYKLGKKTKKEDIECFGVQPGDVKNSAKGKMFQSFTKMAKKASGAKKQKLQAMAKAGKSACQNPDFLSLDQYKGPFGPSEARILYNRFGIGATPEQIALSAAEGLDKTVQRLTTWVDEPGLKAVVAALECDGRLPNDPQFEPCDPTDPNDLYLDGVRYGRNYSMQYSQNQFFEKVFHWLHDERLATSTSALSYCDQYAIRPYMDAVMNTARSGDYKQYMRSMMYDLMMHLEWLDGAVNHFPYPNENWAREFWELGTVGPTDLNGAPVYTDADVANAALAFSGWDINGYDINGNWVCLASFVPGLHAPGPKVIFAGTPHQAVVYGMDDLLEATFRHPRTAEHLAEDLWKEFMNPFATSFAIRDLAKLIRDNNYNLMPVFRTLMKSRALYAQKSRRTLLKHPIELVVGFIRTTGVPINYWYMDQILREVGQRQLRPDTVFGWNPEKLAGEAYVLPRRNELLMLMTQSDEEFTEYGYNFHGRFLWDLPATTTLIDRVAEWLDIPLNPTQKARLLEYMDYDLEPCSWGHQQQCAAGQSYLGQGLLFLDRDQFDPHPGSENWNYKLRGLLAILTTMPQFGLK